jgi:GT2 family glycosyltransferase/LmbE family N-acetylglucosaminyl deacetylase
VDRPVVRVQTVVKPGEVQLLEGWIECLAASARHAAGREHLGSVEVAIADASGSEASLQLGEEDGQWCTRWTVQRLPPDEGRCRAHNMLFGSAEADPDFVLLADPASCLAPSCLSALLSSMHDAAVGAAEPRQLPLESLKSYDLGSGDTSWASGRCCLIRWSALASTGGFDVDTFPAEGADVDLSWRLRAGGWSIRHVPWAAFLDRFEPARSDPSFGGDASGPELAKLLLGARYGGSTLASAWAAAWTIRGTEGQRLAAAEFQSRRTAGTLPAEAVDTSTDLVPELFALGSLDWPSYDEALGLPARTSTSGPRQTARSQPFLSVIVRTQGRRLAALEENLLSLTAQTCQDFEVLLVGHDLGPAGPAVASLVEAFPAAFGRRVRLSEVAGGGRSRPLNAAVGQARGRYVAFLDDDDVAFANWVEAFRRVAEERGGVVWTEVAVQAVDQISCAGRETWRVREPPASFAARFDLLAHLRRNATPNCALAIPATVFHDQGIGFREDLDVLEDWDLLLRVVQLDAVHETQCVSALYRRGMSGDTASVTTTADWDAAEAEVLGALDRSGFVIRGEYLPVLRDALDELDFFSEQPPGVASQLKGSSGRMETSLAGRVVILSPHLDDAVLSCGDLIWQIPHCTVLTIFAGSDVEWSELRDWDRIAGFHSGEDVVARRIEEDDEALAVLGAEGVRLSFLDEQYRDPGVIPPVEALSREIQAALEAVHADVAFMPLGLRHGDHKLAAAAAQHAARTGQAVRWYAYQDLPYTSELQPGIDEALTDLADFDPTEVVLGLGRDAERKDRALDCYRSQLIALGEERRSCALLPERYWALTTPVP